METLITGAVGFVAGILFSRLYLKTQSRKIRNLREENKDLKRRLANLKSWSAQLLLAQKREEKKKAEKSEKKVEKLAEG